MLRYFVTGCLMFAVIQILALAGDANAKREKLSPVHELILRLAKSNLNSEAHELPEKALSEFSQWTKQLLRNSRHQKWEIRTVHKQDDFDFIQVQTNEFMIRQTPEVFLFSFSLDGELSENDAPKEIIRLVQNHITGDWGNVDTTSVLNQDGAVLLKGNKGIEEGTSQNGFLAVVIGDKVHIALPKRTSLLGSKEYSFSLTGNLRWFKKTGGNKTRR